jgi:hypothetical protein
MCKGKQFVILLSVLVQGCGTFPSQRDHVILGVGAGGAAGAAAGATLSPNDDSRGINALVFGLSGALIGGLIGFFTSSTPETPKGSQTLEEKEKLSANNTKEYVVSPSSELPEFLKKRMSPAVVEEFIETDQVGEDGSLHAPHKVYRIKHAAELIAKPNSSNQEVKSK